jgi:hypothetical protein
MDGSGPVKIERVIPKPPPTEIQMTFGRNAGWAIVAALKEYAAHHPYAAHVENWKRWADDLDEELRRDD